MKKHSLSRILCVAVCLAAALLPAGADTGDRKFETFSAADGLADNSAQTIRCTKTGRLVITTMGQINFFDGVKFSYIDPTRENLYPLSAYTGNYHLYFDRYHHLWLKNRHSVTCVDLTREKFVPSIESVFGEFGVEGRVRDLFVDQRGVVYLLDDEGLYSVELKRRFDVRRQTALQDVETYGEKYLLLFYEDGRVDVLELGTGSSVFREQAYGPADRRAYGESSLVLADGSAYYQLRNGGGGAVLLRFDIGKWEWRELLRTPYHLNGLALDEGTLYVPCEYGYWTYDTARETAAHVENLQLSDGRLLNTDVNTMAFDRQGGMWIGTERRGLLYARPFSMPFTAYGWSDRQAGAYAVMMDALPQHSRFRDRPVNCVYRDSRRWTWVGTASGLQLYRKDSDRLPQVFTRRDGLLNNVIHSVVEDRLHNVWVGTSYGISCLLLDRSGRMKTVLSYGRRDNVPGESFVNGRAMCLADGTVVMQSLDHVVAFNPSKMATLTERLKFDIYPKLIRLLVNGNEARTGERLDGTVVLEKALTRTGELNLDYNQNSLSLTFSALNYFRPEQTCYRVRVRGLDDSWKVLTTYNSEGMVDSKGQLHLPLVALKPGSYTVELQASMWPDEWDTEPYEWVININEPWWRTTGMFALLGLVLLVLAAVYAYVYLRNANMRARRNSEEQSIVKRLKWFASQCGHPEAERISPTAEEIGGSQREGADALSREFVDMMLEIMPTIRQKKASQLTMRMLSSRVGMDLQKFYSVVSTNIYKNPRTLVRKAYLKRAGELLRHSGKDVADVAYECGFASPNYFIAAFFREYGMLPEDYSKSA